MDFFTIVQKHFWITVNLNKIQSCIVLRKMLWFVAVFAVNVGSNRRNGLVAVAVSGQPDGPAAC
jgi:hypothetical protein